MKEEFEYGDIVEVRNGPYSDWEKGKFLILDKGPYPYVVRVDGTACASGYSLCRKVRPDLKIDDPVWVRDSKADEWLPRHFAGWFNRRIQTFNNGTTSHSNTNIATWEFYSLEKPKEASS